MIAAILRAQFGDAAVLATRGNFNNEIGLPLTLLELRATHRAAVIELGMNHRGETRELAAIARPTIALVNNAQREHQEFMRSVGEVAAEHADVLLALREGGIAVINADDAHARVWRGAAERCGARGDLRAATRAPMCARARRCMPTAATLDIVVPGGEHARAHRRRRARDGDERAGGDRGGDGGRRRPRGDRARPRGVPPGRGAARGAPLRRAAPR